MAALAAIGLIGDAMGSTEPASRDIATTATSTPSTTEAPATDHSAAPTSAGPTTAEAVPARVTMPKLVGKRLSVAEELLSALGIDTVHARDASPEGRIVLLSTNWIVTAQDHRAGSSIDPATAVTLHVRKPSDGEGSSDRSPGTVPNVTCMDLQAAQDTLQAAGFFNLGSEDGTGQGRMQIFDRDWVVIAQSVPAGAQPSPLKRIVLTSVKYSEPTGSSNCRS